MEIAKDMENERTLVKEVVWKESWKDLDTDENRKIEEFKILENAKNYDRKSKIKEEIFCMCFLGDQSLKILVKITFHPIFTRSKYGLKTSEKSEFIYSLLSPHSHFLISLLYCFISL